MSLPEPRAETTIAWATVIFVLASSCLCTRVYFDHRRWRSGTLTAAHKTSLGFAMAAWVCFAVSYALVTWSLAVIIQERHSEDRLDELLHQQGITIYLSTLPMYLKVMFSAIIIVAAGIWFVKASFLAMYFDISARLSTTLRWTLYLTCFYVVFSYLVVFISLLVWCPSLEEVFRMDKYLFKPSAYCNPFNYVKSTTNLDLYTVMNTTSDFAVMVTPLLILRGVQLSRRDMWGVLFLLGLGTLTLVTTIVRTALMAQSTSWGKSRFQTGQLLALAECAAAIVAVSLPSIRAAWNGMKASKMVSSAALSERQTYTFGHDAENEKLSERRHSRALSWVSIDV